MNRPDQQRSGNIRPRQPVDKGGILEYLSELPKKSLNLVYQKPASCLGVLRLLPDLAKNVFFRMLYITSLVSRSDIECWCGEEDQDQYIKSIQILAKLNIIENTSNGVKVNPYLQNGLHQCLVVSGDHKSFGECIEGVSPSVTPGFLDKYASDAWEDVLYYLVGIKRCSQSSTVRKLLAAAGLKEPIDPSKISQGGSPEDDTTITKRGFEFLLRNIEAQIWSLLLQYLRLAEGFLKLDSIDVLNFILQIESMEIYQKVVLEDLKHLGLFYKTKDQDAFYPTVLIRSLTSGSRNSSLEGSKFRKSFIIVETNYKVYAYTDSPLDLAILNLFVVLRIRFRNMVSGAITRSSVRRAFERGLTSDLIIKYLTMHAHPELLRQNPIIPSTVTDQIKLWEMELNRVQHFPGYLYTDFSKRQEYEAILRVCESCGYTVWKDSSNMIIFVTLEGHNHIKELRKSRNI